MTSVSGTSLGILGGGQLAMMLAEAAAGLGVKVMVVEPSRTPPSARVAEVIPAEYDDMAALEKLASTCSAVTYEFENVPANATAYLASKGLAVFPPPKALEVAQDRLSEKKAFRALGIDTALFVPVASEDELHKALDETGVPAVLKTRRFGYDGRGQFVLRSTADVTRAFRGIGSVPAILEPMIPFIRELSVVGARAADGSVVFYPLVENQHAQGILRRTDAPAERVTREMQSQAESFLRVFFEYTSYVGVGCLELFELAGGRLIANEVAPRVHNSGHWSIEGAETSQFENHVRAVLGLPLTSTAARARSTMLNLIGHEIDATQLATSPVAHVHNYGKEPRPNRKMGHITFVEEGGDREAFDLAIQQAATLIIPGSGAPI